MGVSRRLKRQKNIPVHVRHAWARMKDPNSICLSCLPVSSIGLRNVTWALELMTPKRWDWNRVGSGRALEFRYCEEMIVIKNLNSWLEV